uniref:(northern house mosquito) hypothetical protein n=1 Tax=Culex pipiens TaxID=7175 RepID=A0A8D8BY07_CULPI
MFLAEVAHVVDCPQGQRIHRVRSGLDLGVHKQRLTTLHVVTRLTKNVGLFVHRIGVTVLDGSRVVRASANRNDDLLNRPHLAGQLGHEVLVHSVDNCNKITVRSSKPSTPPQPTTHPKFCPFCISPSAPSRTKTPGSSLASRTAKPHPRRPA